MQLESEEWVTMSEAARLLGVSHQRVGKLVDKVGALDVLRPWPNVTLIGRRSIAERLAGHRQPNITTAHVRRWLLERCEATVVRDIDIDVARDRLRDFIEEARPRWDAARKDLWALEMTETLRRYTRAPAA